MDFHSPITLREQPTPSAPAVGGLKIYSKSDDKVYQQNSAGVESLLGGGSLTVVLTTGEALNDGDWVNIDATGVAGVRQANATAEGREVWGYVKAAYGSGVPATVYLSGLNDHLSGLVSGASYFLSTSAGQASRSLLTASGNVVQSIGVALSATSIYFQRGVPVTRA